MDNNPFLQALIEAFPGKKLSCEQCENCKWFKSIEQGDNSNQAQLKSMERAELTKDKKLLDRCTEPEMGDILVYSGSDSGTLERILRVRKSIPEKEALQIIYQLSKGLSMLHKQKQSTSYKQSFLQRLFQLDLGSCNVFVTKENEFGCTLYMLGDYGFINACHKKRPPHLHEKSNEKTVEFKPLEFYKGEITEKSDMWQLGQLFFRMIFGQYPLVSEGNHEKNEKIFKRLDSRMGKSLETHFLYTGEIDGKITDETCHDQGSKSKRKITRKTWDLMKSLLRINPNDRPSAADVVTKIEEIGQGGYNIKFPPSPEDPKKSVKENQTNSQPDNENKKQEFELDLYLRCDNCNGIELLSCTCPQE